MEWKDEDFANMLYPIRGLSISRSVMETFPILSALKGWIGMRHYPRENLFRFIIYMYDLKSPLQRIDDPAKRAAEALELAEIHISSNDGKYSDEVEDCIEGLKPHFNMAVVDFLRIQKRPDWSELVVQERIFYRLLNQAMLKPEDEGIGNAKSLSEQKKRLNDATQAFIGMNNQVRLMQSVYGYTLIQDLDFTPEAVAKALADGKEIFPEYQ